MSIAEAAGRAARTPSRFTAIKSALVRQTKDLSRARRRWSALLPTYRKRALMTAGAVTLGAEPLRLLQAILDHADVIALDVREPGHTGAVHMLVTLPDWLLDRATAIAAYDEDDEDTDGGEEQQDLEDDADSEASLAFPDGVVDQSRNFHVWNLSDGDRELDPAEREPSLAGVDSEDQSEARHGNMTDREDDDDREPDERDWPWHGDGRPAWVPG